MRRGFASNYRSVLLTIAVSLCFVGLGVRLVFLHVLDREHLLRMVEKARTSIIVENARRGDIRDQRGRILATSKTQIILGVDPQMLRPEDEAKWPQLATMIGMPLHELRRIFTTKTRAVGATASSGAVKSEENRELRFEFKLSDEEARNEVVDTVSDANGLRKIQWAKLREDVDESLFETIKGLEIQGVVGNRVYRRAYPHASLAAHLVGYVNKQGEPAAGIEAYADFFLRGQNGWVVSEKDGWRRELAQFRTREVAPVDGYNIVLSIDAVVQDIIEEELRAIHDKYHPLKATIIVSDARTGFLLGLANTPTFNLAEYGKADIASMRNVAMTDVLEPGSTFKIVSAAAALDLGLVSPASRFDVSQTSALVFGSAQKSAAGKMRSLPNDDHKFEHPLTLREVLSHSSNRGASLLGIQLGEDRFYSYVKAFGFGEPTGFRIGPEVSGSAPPPSEWDGLTLTRMPIGHSVSATALQVHYAMGVLASGGELLRPQVIREIRDASNEVVFRYDSVSVRRVITRRTAEQMASMLRYVTVKNEGTAPSADIPGFEVAGKTGTTKKIKDGHYSSRHHIASFVGFFPASRPEVVISVIVDEATTNLINGAAYGSSVAAPSFKRIGERLIQYLNIKPVAETPRPLLMAMNGAHP